MRQRFWQPFDLSLLLGLIKLGAILLPVLLLLQSCRPHENTPIRVRGLVDTVGFAHTAHQMEEIIQRIDERFASDRRQRWEQLGLTDDSVIPLAISPHDDYTYAGDVYSYILPLIKAKTIFLFGVAHKARRFNLENKIVFGTFTHYRGPFGLIPVSPIREEIIALLPAESFVVHDSMMTVEHSLEALLPFLQYYHRDFEIVPILVPYMPFSRMVEIARPLAQAIARVAKERHWDWGRDYALLISNDAVHYGDRDWGGKNFARFGADSAGYRKALEYEMTIIRECLVGVLDSAGVHRFTKYTVKPDNYREYQWTWCGRYSVPFGLLTGYFLSQELGLPPLKGDLLKYSTSLEHPPIPVSDLKMGITAPANIHHWVGYAAIAYRFAQ